MVALVLRRPGALRRALCARRLDRHLVASLASDDCRSCRPRPTGDHRQQRPGRPTPISAPRSSPRPGRPATVLLTPARSWSMRPSASPCPTIRSRTQRQSPLRRHAPAAGGQQRRAVQVGGRALRPGRRRRSHRAYASAGIGGSVPRCGARMLKARSLPRSSIGYKGSAEAAAVVDGEPCRCSRRRADADGRAGESRQARGLAVAMVARSPLLPDVPTVGEARPRRAWRPPFSSVSRRRAARRPPLSNG